MVLTSLEQPDKQGQTHPFRVLQRAAAVTHNKRKDSSAQLRTRQRHPERISPAEEHSTLNYVSFYIPKWDAYC